MAVIAVIPPQQFFDADGNPLANGFIYTYQAGTTTPKAAFTDQAGLVPWSNPITLDAAGIPAISTVRTPVFVDGSYKFQVTDALGNIIQTTDNITSFSILAAASNAFFQSFSGTNSQTAFTLSQSMGTDSKNLMVFVSTPALRDPFTGDGSQTAFTLSQNMGTNAKAVQVLVNGTPNTAYTLNGTTLTFTSAPASAATILVYQDTASPFSVLNPNQYTVNGTALTLASAPAAGTNNIMVFSPSSLLGAASQSAAQAASSEANAAASAVTAANAATAATNVSGAYNATSTTSVTIGTGSKSFTTQTGKLFTAGQLLQIASSANSANYMHGSVTSYNSTTGALVMNILDIGGSGNLASWNIAVSGTQGPMGTGSGITGAEATVASAATTNIGGAGSHTILVSGSATITSLGSSGDTNNPEYFIRFTGTPTLTYNATSLILPTNNNIAVQPGDSCVAQYLGSGNWKVISYQSFNGMPLTQPRVYVGNASATVSAYSALVLRFTTVMINLGSYYDTSTGRFTINDARAAGTYLVSTILFNGSNVPYDLYVYKNGSAYSPAISIPGNGVVSSVGSSIAIDMALNDYIECVIPSSSSVNAIRCSLAVTKVI